MADNTELLEKEITEGKLSVTLGLRNLERRVDQTGVLLEWRNPAVASQGEWEELASNKHVGMQDGDVTFNHQKINDTHIFHIHIETTYQKHHDLPLSNHHYYLNYEGKFIEVENPEDSDDKLEIQIKSVREGVLTIYLKPRESMPEVFVESEKSTLYCQPKEGQTVEGPWETDIETSFLVPWPDPVVEKTWESENINSEKQFRVTATNSFLDGTDNSFSVFAFDFKGNEVEI
ncbi:hypothetical protein [Moorena sp. SIO3A2]|uniref:hypothetical protein n=1 Tax=Moorena sp. SIO3A2 TaxID=2607841 RepID=UPI0013BCD4CE|nr:hypothetical protein [Moorena sp. SIO3A2]NER90400.1 hypothetical protein [Moorena sp. SIO3A2]